MLRINLLPDEYRKGAQVPGAWVAALALGAACALAAVGHLAWLYLVRLPALRGERERLAAERATLEPAHREAEAVAREVHEAEVRQQAILDIRGEKVFWSRKIDALVDLVPAHVWLEELELRERWVGPREKPTAVTDGGTLRIVAWSRGDRVDHVSRFREGLRRHRGFMVGFQGLDAPESRLSEVPFAERFLEGERVHTRFEVVLHLQVPPEVRRRLARTAGSASPGAEQTPGASGT